MMIMTTIVPRNRPFATSVFELLYRYRAHVPIISNCQPSSTVLSVSHLPGYGGESGRRARVVNDRLSSSRPGGACVASSTSSALKLVRAGWAARCGVCGGCRAAVIAVGIKRLTIDAFCTGQRLTRFNKSQLKIVLESIIVNTHVGGH